MNHGCTPRYDERTCSGNRHSRARLTPRGLLLYCRQGFVMLGSCGLQMGL